jgi:transcriptional regulator with XRE-family HTH domain
MTGNELRDIRKAARLNQEAFGQLVGMGRVAVSDWERGVNAIPDAVELIARVFDAHPEMLPEMERWRGMRK